MATQRPSLDRRHVVSFFCLCVTVADYIMAVGANGQSVATHMALPISCIATIAVAVGFGLWPGLVTGTVLGLWGALIPASDIGPAVVVLESAIGGLTGRSRDLQIALRRGRAQSEAIAARYRALSDHATDLVLVFDPQGNATFASPSHAALLGRDAGTMLGLGYYDAFGPSGVAQLLEAFQKIGPGHSERLELPGRHHDGSARTLAGTLRNATLDPAIAGFIFNASDVTEAKSAEQRIIAASIYDPLTSLPNRTFLATRIDETLAAYGADGSSAVLFIDLDRFKDVNEVLGHNAGDALLAQVAARLQTAVRDGDLVGRVGGDEFIVMLARTKDAREAQAIAGRIREAIIAPYVIADREIAVGASVGIALAGADLDSNALLRHADVAMHVAKRKRDGIAMFSKVQDERATRRLTMATALSAAIENDEFVVHYQPQLDVRTGFVRGAEALVRWEHPERGLLYPDFFLPIAEEIGEMDRLTAWILRTAIKRARRWARSGHDLRVSVNLSAHDLRDDRLAEIVPRLLAQHGVAPEKLCLELTETTVITEAESAGHCLRGLSERGVRISIDDFGTGYSAIAHLKQFPVDEIKIDKQFVMNMEHDADDAAIVASTIELAHRLNVDVVVEGVERMTTFEAIKKMGADSAQGYAIGRPLAPAAFDAWVHERRGLRSIISA
jgi:diguanylate cyclase (GGDEF)-like protein/PAS domain S-box-containing protein